METKICNRCGLEKHIKEFKSHKGRPVAYCKLCDNERAKLYRRTLRGHLHKLYNNQKHKSKKRGHPQPSYTFDELKNWFISQPNWEDLWLKWESSGYDTKLAPSVDRLDDSKGYSLDNIRLVTWRENDEKEREKQKVKVNQYDLDGNYIKTFSSITEALKSLNKNTKDGHISQVCKGSQYHAFSYQWRYLSDEFPKDKNIRQVKTIENAQAIRVKATLPTGDELVFDSLTKAGSYFNCTRETISNKLKTGRSRLPQLRDVKLAYCNAGC